MKSYTVTRRELHTSYTQVFANNELDAIAKVQAGDGEEVLVEFDSIVPESYDAQKSEA